MSTRLFRSASTLKVKIGVSDDKSCSLFSILEIVILSNIINRTHKINFTIPKSGIFISIVLINI